MDQQQGWTISQVEGLIGLSRRDIQRCCYAGKGGVDVLSCPSSTWGRRTYDKDDIARLFLVAQMKAHGMSLPEAKRAVDQAGAEGRTDAELIRDHAARLTEKIEQLRSLLLSANALLAADAGGTAADGDEADAATKVSLEEIISERLSLDVLAGLLSNEGAVNATSNEELENIAQELDDPGLALAVDLWAGAGATEQIRSRFGVTAQSY